MSYKIGVQKTPTGQFRVVLYSTANGKLLMNGEPLKNREDADALVCDILDESFEGRIIPADKLIPASKKWPKNSGPKPAKKKK